MILNHKITINSPFSDTFTSNFCLFHKFLQSWAQKFVFQLEVFIITITNSIYFVLISVLHIPQSFEWWFICEYENFVVWSTYLRKPFFNSCLPGKISAQPHSIVKQICFPNGNVLFLYPRTECITKDGAVRKFYQRWLLISEEN